MKDHPLFSLESIYRAYRQCRRRKRNTYNALLFEQNLEENLLDLHQELNRQCYTPQSSLAFLVTKPKLREIFAANFRDRVVHHLLVNHLEPQWERRFIYDSYACRKGKGTHKAVERLRAFTRKVTCNQTRRAWYLQLDVRGFFITLNRQILLKRLARCEFDPTVLWLIQVILFNEPTHNCRFREARRSDFDKLPPHKTLFKAAADCGLPIGNLTSQFFANVYLDALDQFIKHQLQARYYVRYCDDLVLLSASQLELKRWEQQISKFLEAHLQLQLNERRKQRPITDGIDFLGYIVRADYLLVRRRVIGHLRDRLQYAEQVLYRNGMNTYDNGHTVYPYPWPLLIQIRQWLNAYLNHFNKAASYRLVCALRQRFTWLNEYFYWCEIPGQAKQRRFKVVYRLIIEGENEFTFVLSVPLFLEYEAVLKRPEQLVISHLTTQDIDNILAMLAKRGRAIRIPFLWRPQLNDCKDEMVLETAINGQAKAIITFNRKDFLMATLPFGINVLSPSQFYTQLRK